MLKYCLDNCLLKQTSAEIAKSAEMDKELNFKTMLIGLMLQLALGNAGAVADDFHHGLGSVRSGNYDAAVAILTPLAEQGNAKAQFELGILYLMGKGVTQDRVKAASLHLQSAEQGNVKAQAHLGHMLDDGEGVLVDHKSSLKWYLLAAEGGHIDAQYEQIGRAHV